MKKVNYILAALLVFGLTINVIDGIKFDFKELDLKLELKSANSQIELPDDPWPDTGALKCRCRNSSSGSKICGAGNYFSIRPKCAEFSDGTGSCGEWTDNCVN